LFLFCVTSPSANPELASIPPKGVSIMKNLKVLCLVSIVAVGLAGLLFKSHSPTRGQTSANPATASPTVGTKQSPHPSQAPEHVIYRQFFRHVRALKQRAAEMDTHGKNAQALREHYKKNIGLKDKDADLLDQIADECERETAKIDAKAQKIIDAVRRRFPDGRIASPDELPPPPPELKKLQLKRDMMVMRARHRLVTEVGAEGFQQIDQFIKVNFAPDVQPVAARSRRSR
jgi:hypothetical protein